MRLYSRVIKSEIRWILNECDSCLVLSLFDFLSVIFFFMIFLFFAFGQYGIIGFPPKVIEWDEKAHVDIFSVYYVYTYTYTHTHKTL